MIIRIVKMTFQSSEVNTFLEVFGESKEHIRAMPGCSHLELLNDVNDRAVYFTYSYWESERDLENYRHSELFAAVWAKTKILFAAKPEAWSLEQKTIL